MHQPLRSGGSCEGCEPIFESPIPFNQLNWTDTLPDFAETGPKMVVCGIVYKADGKTPAKDVVFYIYHTDQTGKYTNKNKRKVPPADMDILKDGLKQTKRDNTVFIR